VQSDFDARFVLEPARKLVQEVLKGDLVRNYAFILRGIVLSITLSLEFSQKKKIQLLYCNKTFQRQRH